MPSRSLILALATLSITSAAFGHGRDPHASVASRNGWKTSLAAAKREAAKADKPLLIVLRCFD